MVYKKVISLIAAAACLLAATGVSAVSINTTTTYESGSDIKVESTVTGLNADESVTYLAYGTNGGTTTTDNLTDEDVVYVDQQIAAGDSVTFTYLAAATDIGSAVLVGNSNTEQGTASDVILLAEGVRASVTIKEGDTVYFSGTAPEKQTEGDTNLIKFDLTQAAVISSVAIGGTPASYWFTGADNQSLWIAEEEFKGALDGADPVDVTIVTSTTSPSVSTQALNYFDSRTVIDDGETYTGNSLVAVGRVTGSVKEFGILFGTSESEVDAYTGSYSDGGNAYPALGKNADGQYAVQLIDVMDFPEYVYARAYYIDAEGNKHYAEKSGKYWSGGLESFSLGSYNAVIDNAKGTITVDLPLFDASGASVDISNMTVTAETKSAAQELIIGTEALSGSDTVFTGSYDASNGGKNVFLTTSGGTVIYKLNIYRVYEENFDGSYVTAGVKTYDGSAWTGSNPISGNAGSIWSWAQAANSGDNVTYGFSALEGNKTAWDYLSEGVVPYTDAKVNGSDTEPLPIAPGGAAPNGNSLAVIKSMAFQGKDSNMMSVILGKSGVSDGGMTGLDSATDFTLEYDIAYDYNMEADFTDTDGNSYTVYKSPLTAGATIYGMKSDGGNCHVLRQTSSESTNPSSSIISVGNYLPTGGENNSSDNGVNGYFRALDSSYTAEKWHRIKTQVTRNNTEADSDTNLYEVTTKVSVDGNAPEYNETYYAGWPYRIQFKTPARRAIGTYIDNVKVRYNLTGDYTDTLSSLRSFAIDEYQGTIDKSAKTISVEIPMWDESGSAVAIDSSWITTAETSAAGDAVVVGRTALSGGTTKTGVIDYTNGGCNVTVNGENYKLIVNRVISEDFESGVSGTFGDFTATKRWYQGQSDIDGWIVTGSERRKWYTAEAKKASSDSDGAYLQAKSISVVPQSNVKKLDDSTSVMPTGATSASGNVLKINNPSNGNSANSGNTDYGRIAFRIGTAELFTNANANAATRMTFEYDVAYGNEGTSGRVTPFMNGAYIDGGSTSYTSEGTLLARLSGPNAFDASNFHQYQAGSDASGTASSSAADLSQWRNVKVVFSRETAVSESAVIEVYYDGVKQEKTWTTTSWPNQISFRGAVNRACQTYIDNAKITYDLPGNYSSVWLDSFTVQDSETEISGDTITVSLPLYDLNGNTVGITALQTTASVTGSGDVVLYTSSDDTTGTVITGTNIIDWSAIGTGATITCGDKTYALNVERVLSDDFDTNTLFGGASKFTATLKSDNSAISKINEVAADESGSAFDGKGDFANAVSSNGLISVFTSGIFDADTYAQYIDAFSVGLGVSTAEATAEAPASGNALKVSKTLAYKNKDTSAVASVITVPAANATRMVYEFDAAYDYEGCTMSGNNVVGTNSVGPRIYAGNTELLRMTGSASKDTTDKRSTNTVSITNQKNTSETVSVSDLTKWHHIKIEFTRESATAESVTCTVWTDGVQSTAILGTNMTWPDNMKIYTSTRRASNTYIDNLDIRYNLN